MANAGIRVEGLKELRKALREMEDDATWKGELQRAGKNAAEIVAAEARRTAGAASNPRMGHVAAESIRALAGQTRATVAGGKASVPWFGGHEFGSSRYHQFPGKRAGGYHLYPAIHAKQAEVVAAYRRDVDAIIHKRFPG